MLSPWAPTPTDYDRVHNPKYKTRYSKMFYLQV